jgi:hypothetical protein
MRRSSSPPQESRNSLASQPVARNFLDLRSVGGRNRYHDVNEGRMTTDRLHRKPLP